MKWRVKIQNRLFKKYFGGRNYENLEKENQKTNEKSVCNYSLRTYVGADVVLFYPVKQIWNVYKEILWSVSPLFLDMEVLYDRKNLANQS